MKRIIGVAALLTLVAATALAPRAMAQCVTGTGTNILLKWDANGFAWETNGPGFADPLQNPVGFMSTPGSTLHNELATTLLCGPLAGLDPNAPGYEVTMVWDGLVSHGTTTSPFGSSGTKYVTVYTGGTFQLFQGPVNARGFDASTVPQPPAAYPLYADGSVILSGTLDTLTTTITVSSFGTVGGSFRGRYTITGGPYKSQFCNGQTVAALFDGVWVPTTPPPGYEAHDNGKFDAPDCATPASRSTWGKIKALYR
ncbi:MAG TPA: hypothetical protein VGU27_04585 [Candidatus Eisenbacteria bacterium]|nr:hypothetical protein [Candidatus Eisenbacteria bacterium]